MYMARSRLMLSVLVMSFCFSIAVIEARSLNRNFFWYCMYSSSVIVLIFCSGGNLGSNDSIFGGLASSRRSMRFTGAWFRFCGASPCPMSMYGDMGCGSLLAIMFEDRGLWPGSWRGMVAGFGSASG